jgi:hypothetical protein
VKDAPDIHSDEIDGERELYEYYGLDRHTAGPRE